MTLVLDTSSNSNPITFEIFFLELDSTNDDSMYDSSFDSTETQPYFEAGSLIKLENGECKKVEELSRADFETVCLLFIGRV